MDTVDDLSHMKKIIKSNCAYDRSTANSRLLMLLVDCQLLIAHVTCQLQENKRIDS